MGLVPQASPIAEPVKEPLVLKKRLVDTPSRVARILKLIDESEDLEAQQPLQATLGPIPTVQTLEKEPKVEIIEALF